MSDMSDTIIPKSDQLNADSLLAGPLTIRITGVSIVLGEQPATINYDGDGGRPFRPGLSMRRVLVTLWGPDAKLYVGRSLTLYTDPSVVFGGMAVGGIRISHASHIAEPVTMMLTSTKGKRKPFTVRPLVVDDAATSWADATVASIAAAVDHAALEEITKQPSVVKRRAQLAERRPELAERVSDAIASALAVFDRADAGEMEV